MQFSENENVIKRRLFEQLKVRTFELIMFNEMELLKKGINNEEISKKCRNFLFAQSRPRALIKILSAHLISGLIDHIYPQRLK